MFYFMSADAYITRSRSRESTMNMSHLEKRATWLLIDMLVIYGIYFARALRNVGQSQFAGEALYRLFGQW